MKIEIIETLSRIIEIDDVSEKDALKLIKKKYSREEIVLDSNDFVDVKIKICEDFDL